MRLGILGGTFDPVHRGHLALATAARDEMALDGTLFVPAGRPWRKADRTISSEHHRLAMLELALEGKRGFEIDTRELERPGPSYTVDTLEALRGERPGAELFFLLGEDAVTDLPNWVRPGRILELATLVAARRPGTPGGAVEEAEGRLAGLAARLVWLAMPVVEVSATEIRGRVRRGLPIDDMVPPVVEAYIREQGLYRD